MGATLTTRTRTLRATLTTLTLTLTLSLAPPPNQVREHLENLKLKEINTAKDVRHPATLATQASRPGLARAQAGLPLLTRASLASPWTGFPCLHVARDAHAAQRAARHVAGMLQARSAYRGCANHGYTTPTMTCAACYRWRHTIYLPCCRWRWPRRRRRSSSIAAGRQRALGSWPYAGA